MYECICTKPQSNRPPTTCSTYNFAPISFFACSLKIRFKIFPEAFFGISSTNTIPPVSILNDASRSFMCLSISCDDGLLLLTSLRTRYARGDSEPSLFEGSGIPMTAASTMSG